MRSAERLKGRVANTIRVFFPTSILRREQAIRFHISSSQPILVDQTLLSGEDMEQLAKTPLFYSHSEGSLVAARLGRFVQNYAKARLLMDAGKYTPRVVVAGKSGLYNALAVEMISLGQGIKLVTEEARAIEDARRGNPDRDLLVQPLDAPLYTPLLERFLGRFQSTVDHLEISKEPKITIIGSAGNQLVSAEEFKKEIVRQVISPYDEQLLDNKLALLHIPWPLEIGLETTGGKTKYVIGATAIGIGGVIAILALRKYQARKRAKKV